VISHAIFHVSRHIAVSDKTEPHIDV